VSSCPVGVVGGWIRCDGSLRLFHVLFTHFLPLPRLLIPKDITVLIPPDYPPRPPVVRERYIDRVSTEAGMGDVAKCGHVLPFDLSRENVRLVCNHCLLFTNSSVSYLF